MDAFLFSCKSQPAFLIARFRTSRPVLLYSRTRTVLLHGSGWTLNILTAAVGVYRESMEHVGRDR